MSTPKTADTAPELTTEQPTTLKPYQKLTEEGEIISKYKYRPGTVRQYRFDGKAGVFNLNGEDVIGKSLTFQPMSWRFFTGDLFAMGPKEWVELFFIDAKNCVSAVLFHGYSVDNLIKLEEPLFFDDQTLADVVLTATAEKKQNKDGGTYFMAQFTYAPAPADKIAELAAFTADVPVYRKDTINRSCVITLASGYPFGNEDINTLFSPEPAPAELPAPVAETPLIN